jgi:hypothetical protein
MRAESTSAIFHLPQFRAYGTEIHYDIDLPGAGRRAGELAGRARSARVVGQPEVGWRQGIEQKLVPER